MQLQLSKNWNDAADQNIGQVQVPKLKDSACPFNSYQVQRILKTVAKEVNCC